MQSSQHPAAVPTPPTLACCCRSAIPVVCSVLGVVVMNKYPTRQEATALIVLTLGVMLAVWQVRERASRRGGAAACNCVWALLFCSLLVF